MPPTTEIVRTTCPRDCYDSCGIVVVKRDGNVSQVRGDPDHPVSRGKLWRKGEGRFEALSWDVALAAIAERFRSIVATTGAHAILNAHYTGTISLIAFLFPLRFFNRLGATEVAPDTICNMAGRWP